MAGLTIRQPVTLPGKADENRSSKGARIPPGSPPPSEFVRTLKTKDEPQAKKHGSAVIDMRQAFGCGTPRALHGAPFGPRALHIALGMLVTRVWMAATHLWRVSRSLPCVSSASWTIVSAS